MGNITIEEIEQMINDSYTEYMELIESFEEYRTLIQDLANNKNYTFEEPL